ncbi:MAG: 4Fe-4S cluster-binding domain-containing protein [Paludibacteraceae bacterium]|nr:4Fe-4S cluster-binding domain-containing protein [Paludibacteraceae bacterium]
MTRDEIKTLLDSQEIEFRRVAIDAVVMSFPIYADLFFSAFQKDDAFAVQMADAARQWMPVLRDGYDESVIPFDGSVQYTSFGTMAASYSVFLQEMHNYLAGLDKPTAQKTINTLWHHFPGLRIDLKGKTVNPKPEEHRQLMVFVTGNCNLHCPYCFSKELKRASISKTDMTRVLSWAQRQNVQSLLPCGGEPLLYENMDWLIREVEQRGMKMYFATNLSVPLPQIMMNGDTDCIEQLHVHLTNELFHNERLMSTFLNNLRLCRENGIDIILRGNIFGDDTEEHYNEWFRIAKAHGINALNVAFTIPSHTGSNSFVHIEAIQAMIPRLRRILEQGREDNIRVSLAKPLPLCVFPEDLATDILLHDMNAAFCNVYEDEGMHNLSLSTDLRFSPCLGVDEPSVPFADDLNWENLRSIFGPAVHEMQSRPLLDRCSNCFLYDRRLCQGSCLSYKQDSRKGGVRCAD